MKKNLLILPLLAFMFFTACDNSSKFKYETVSGDPLNTRIYTLDNGLKVYLSVNKDKPRVQTYIGVRVGSKNDPAETTGLAHYFEHLMFKGTEKFGTSDYAAEKPYLDKIEELFEIYRKTTDEEQRKTIYAEIDSISQLASQIAIPNEYDKLMSAIGAEGSNAFTALDLTAYVENIPSNEIENWAIIQSDRFTNPVIRLFHTELETVYEEYNMGLTSDSRKSFVAMLEGLFPHHTYGTQTVIGTQEHLKNPSITNIKNYFETYYVPNNMAICMVGDIDPDATINTINKYFGSMKAKDIPELKVEIEKPIEKPVIKEVTGLEAENMTIAYRLPAANTKDAAILQFMDYLLTNGKAGLIDLNLVKQQKVLNGGSTSIPLSDYSIFMMYGTPKQGQTLDEVRDLLLGQLDMLKKGEFEDWLLEAVINNFRLDQYYQQQSSEYAAHLMLTAFINNVDWKDQVGRIDYQSKLTKKDIVDFCNKYFNDNYVLVYKKQGKPDDKKIDKPQITPISANRDNESAFLAEIKAREVNPIEPVFLDFSKDMSKLSSKNDIPVLYKQNTTDPLFSLYYVFEMGNNNDKALGTAFEYLKYLGTGKHSAEEIEREMYKMACSFGVFASSDRVYVYVNGLSDNFEKAMELLEERLSDPVANTDAFSNLVNDILKKRVDAKSDQQSNFNKLWNYAYWGDKSPSTNILSEKELKGMNPNDLVKRIKDLKNYEHKILYYGPMQQEDFVQIVNKNHNVADEFQPIPPETVFEQRETTENLVLLANYDAKQIYMAQMHKGVSFDRSIEPVRTMYNAYFGGGMNSVVFQEMREARALAYSAWAGYVNPAKLKYAYIINTFIATQNDKLKDAITTFEEILNNMPESEKAFNIAKENTITTIRTQRILRENVLWSYLDAVEFNYNSDPRKDIFEKVPALTLGDVKAFQENYIKDKPYTYCILGDLKDLDMEALNKLGKVQTLTQSEIFGY